ncbi:hypothetical protein BHM03_00023353 [Ensete ventricosum]|uniref:Uncharacterized protein n=1 Tax=Ensete ventricosum TaxID=4639 RepID=A0A445MGH6_ENSVE|nr:hypothetical protein BHM03_00023353 [Ensete ventricosum]
MEWGASLHYMAASSSRSKVTFVIGFASDSCSMWCFERLSATRVYVLLRRSTIRRSPRSHTAREEGERRFPTRWGEFAGELDPKLLYRKTRGMGAGRKLKTHRRRQRWADKAYKKSHLGNEWKKPFAGSSHAKGIVLEKM